MLTGPTADDYMPIVIAGGMLAIIFVGLPLLKGEFKIPGRILGAVGIVILGAVLAFALYDVLVRYPRTIEAYRAQRYQIVAGCLSGFVAGEHPGHTSDSIELGGRTFSYADYISSPGFHQTEAYGGPIHPNTWVRLFLVGSSIVRVDVAQNACPSAPRFAAPSDD